MSNVDGVEKIFMLTSTFHVTFGLLLFFFIKVSSPSAVPNFKLSTLTESEQENMINQFAALLIDFISPREDHTIQPFSAYLYVNRSVLLIFRSILESKISNPVWYPNGMRVGSRESMSSTQFITLKHAFLSYSVEEVITKFGDEPIIKKIVESIERICQQRILNLSTKMAILKGSSSKL